VIYPAIVGELLVRMHRAARRFEAAERVHAIVGPQFDVQYERGRVSPGLAARARAAGHELEAARIELRGVFKDYDENATPRQPDPKEITTR